MMTMMVIVMMMTIKIIMMAMTTMVMVMKVLLFFVNIVSRLMIYVNLPFLMTKYVVSISTLYRSTIRAPRAIIYEIVHLFNVINSQLC